MADLPLAADFPPVSRADWHARVVKVLKGAVFEDRLVHRTADGIPIGPIHESSPGIRAGRETAAPWTVVQRLDHPDPVRANGQARDDVANGATGLALHFEGAAHGFGLRDAETATLAGALDTIRLDTIALRLDAGPVGRKAAHSLAKLIAGQPIDPARLGVAFGMDPIGVLARRGHLGEPWPERARLMSESVVELARRDFQGPYAQADGRVWHDLGATEAQELGAALASGVAYLRALDTLDDAILARAVGVTLSAAQDPFMTMAKFRAMRLLWGRILAASGLPTAPFDLHAETSWPMMARQDPHTNILRATAGVFGAGLGGATSIAALPFSLAQGLPNAFARRVARNAQTILLEEANLWRVADAAFGSGYVEHLSGTMCERAWAWFQDIEQQGGIVAVLESGSLMNAIETAAATPAPILGVTLHPHDDRAPPAIEMELA